MRQAEAITFVYEDDNGEEVEVQLPSRFEVCSRCRGAGKHVNPNVDGHGITAEEWNGPDWDDDSREGYLTGRYDVTCSECKGLRVVAVVDEAAVDPEMLLRYNDHLETVARWDADDAHTRRMESGGGDW